MIMRSCELMFCFLLLATSGYSQFADTLKISGSESKISLLPHSLGIHSPGELTVDSAYQFIKIRGEKISKAAVGYTKDVYWLSFSVKNQTEEFLEEIIELDNPQIDCVRVFVVGSSIRSIASTGDRFHFTQRPFLHRNFAFPVDLNPSETKTFLLQIDKRNSSVSFPLFIWGWKEFSQRDYQYNLGYGIYFGFILLCAVYALLTFLFLRKTIYFWYFCWIVASGIFIGTALGLSFQYLYPGLGDFNSAFRVYVQLFSLLTFLKFAQQFLKIPQLFVRTNGVLNVLIYLLTAIMVSSFFLFDFYERISYILLPFINISTSICTLIVVYVLIAGYRQNRQAVLFFVAAFGALILGAFIIILSEFGMISSEHLAVNPYMIGSGVELLIFSFALTFQIKKIYDERNLLSLNMAKHHNELLKSFVEGVEKERERVSRELHDDIGSRLSNLKRYFSQSESNENLQKQIDTLCEDVRIMSHQLSPPSLKITGLKEKLMELAEETTRSSSTKVSFQFYDVPENLAEELTHHLYRIVQEALSNAIKHAQAAEVDIQFFGHDGELVITIDDNGKGFDALASKSGIGLKNIQARAESMNGRVEMSSTINRGTSLMVSIPVATNSPSVRHPRAR